MEEQVDVDVLVAGAGACGLIAAIKAHEQGCSVAIVEKFDRFAGNTVLSCGSIPAAGTRMQKAAGINDSVSQMIADMERVSGQHDSSHLIATIVSESARLVEWLVDYCGVEINLYTNYKHVGHSIPRLHTQPTGQGSELINSLAKTVQNKGIDLAFNNPLRRLRTQQNGAVIGAEIGTKDHYYVVNAKKIIIATNGFGANPSLVKQFCPELSGSQYFGAQSAQGEAIEWGQFLDAKLGNVGSYQAHASVAYPHGELLTWSITEKGAFFVNRNGCRFGNENKGYSGFAKFVMEQGNEAFAIYDSNIRDYVCKYQPTYKTLVDMGGAKEYDDLEILCKEFNINASNLRQTLENYNLSALGQKTDQFGRKDFGLSPLKKPYVITRVNAALFHTQGGLMVDEKAHVLKTDNSIIRNLFAGGGAAVGFSGLQGGDGYVSGNGLLSATVLGMIAGENAALECKNESLRH